MTTPTNLKQSNISSGIKTGKSKNAQLSKSSQKQYIVDKSKFVNTKNYVIDFQDVSN